MTPTRIGAEQAACRRQTRLASRSASDQTAARPGIGRTPVMFSAFDRVLWGCSLRSRHLKLAPPVPASYLRSMHKRAWTILLVCWIAATGASLGSLFFSEVMELPPCSLCWYQRTFMFPLAVVLLVGVLSQDLRCTRYALPLAVGGGGLALYHVLLHIGVIPESAAPCSQGVSCTEVQFELLGFASIPVLSLAAFTVVG